MEITWNISQLNCYPQDDGKSDVVFNVHWQCNGTQADGEQTYNASVYSTCSVTLNPEDPFTPYDQLTQEQVLGWIWSSGVDKDATEAAVAKQIETQINPPVISPPLPWATQNPAA